MQHGSILVDIDWDAWASVFSYASDAGRERARRKLPTRMTSLKEELGHEVTPEEVSKALHHAFERALSITLEPGSLTVEEEALARRLTVDKYATEEWTART